MGITVDILYLGSLNIRKQANEMQDMNDLSAA
jgi:hypothetical protein